MKGLEQLVPIVTSQWMESEAEIIEAVRNGEVERFAILVERYSSRVFRLVRRFVGSEADARDLAQDVWIKAYQKLGEYRGTAPFEHWLMRIATRACYDYLRSRQRNREHTFSELTAEDVEWLSRYAQAPEKDFHDVEAIRALVKKLLDRLPPDSRLVITLLDIEGRSVKEVASITGWSETLVKVRAFRARARMRRMLTESLRRKYL